MAEISVFVQKKDNNNFLNNLFNDIDHEIISEVDDSKIVLSTTDTSIEEIYNVLVKNIFEEFLQKILINLVSAD